MSEPSVSTLERHRQPCFSVLQTDAAVPVAMGGTRPPVPLLAFSLLLGLLAVKELATPAPYRAAPQAAAGKGGELEDDDTEDPFDFGDDDKGGERGGAADQVDREIKLSKWLPGAVTEEDAVDAEDAVFAAAGEGIETLGDLMDADPSESDFNEWGLSKVSAKRVRRALDDAQDAAGVTRKRTHSADAGSFGRGGAPPVSPGKAALAAGLKYVFYGGMILMWFGERLFGALGMPVPAWHRTLVANKTQVLIGLMVLNQMGPMMLGA